ncbi:MAG: stage II sporulation protein E [Methylocystaceae bacterium]
MGLQLEELEIYPYERLERERKQRRVRQKPHKTRFSWPHFNLNIQQLIGIMQVAKTLLTIETLILWVACLALSRGFILGEVMPFAFAFAAAWLPEQRYQKVGCMIGCLIGFASVTTGWLLVGNLVTVALIIFLLPHIMPVKSNSWILKPLLVTLLVFVGKSSLVALSNPTFYRVMVYSFEALMAGVLTFVFMIARETWQQKKSIQEYSYEEMTALAILVVGLLMGMLDIDFYGVTLVGVLSRFTILASALVWGAAGATVVGVFTGAIPAIATTMFPQTLAAYALTGLLAGLFRYFGRLGVFAGFLAGNLLFTFFIPSTQYNYTALWETALAGVIFFLLPASIRPTPVVASLGGIARESSSTEIKQYMQQVAGERLSRLARVFDEMSATFAPEVSEQLNGEEEVKQIFEQTAAGFCAACSLHNSCWDKEFYRTYRDLMALISQVGENGEVPFNEVDDNLKQRCVKPRELVTTVTCLVNNLKLNHRWERVVEESRGMVASQLKGVSEVMQGLAHGLKVPAEIDDDMREKLLLGCRQHFLPVKDAVPIIMGGHCYLHVMGQACSTGNRCQDEIAPAIGSLMGRSYEVTDRVCPRPARGSCQFTLAPFFTYRVETGVAQTARGTICGDSFTVATLKSGEEMVLIADGMGSGRQAARDSRLAVRMLEELLSSGFQDERAINSVNSVLHLRTRGERFVTLDLVLIKLENAQADLIKVCAAPTFLKRGAAVNLISSPALPAGVFEDIELTRQTLLLQAGDILVMVSDGVLETGTPSSNWLPAFLSVIDEEDPQKLADLVMRKALERVRGQVRDDMTVLCSRVELNYQ